MHVTENTEHDHLQKCCIIARYVLIPSCYGLKSWRNSHATQVCIHGTTRDQLLCLTSYSKVVWRSWIDQRYSTPLTCDTWQKALPVVLKFCSYRTAVDNLKQNTSESNHIAALCKTKKLVMSHTERKAWKGPGWSMMNLMYNNRSSSVFHRWMVCLNRYNSEATQVSSARNITVHTVPLLYSSIL